MDICMLSELFYPFMLGGAERRYYEIAKRLAKRHEVTVYSLRFYGRPKQEEIDGINVVRIGAEHPLDKRRLPPLPTYWPAFFRALGNDYDIIDANQGIASFAGLLKPLIKKPIVATFHDLYWNQWNEYFPFPFSSIGKTMEFMWSKLNYTKIIAVSPATSKKLRYLGFKPPIEVIPSGIDNNLIESIKANKKENSIVFVGRLVSYKNIDKLLTAFKFVQEEHQKALLRIVGAGPEEKKLKTLAKALDINVEFYGFVSEKEKIKIIKSSSLLVNPSSVEGLGLILVESMACGTPVVAKNLETYFFCNENNSVLYGDDEQLGDKILRLLDDKNQAKKISENGLKTSNRFSWDNVAREIEDIYEELV